MDRFSTPETDNTVEIVIKKSRFLGHVVPIQSVEDAEAALELIRTEHKSANHNCFAYTVGLGVPVERFSDDGEPSGTAGRPILEVLRRRQVSNALVVATRYFGGTLLGASGLVRAYTEATAEVLKATPHLACVKMCRLDVRSDYAVYGKLEYELAQQGVGLLEKEFSSDVAFHLMVPEAEVETMLESLSNWTNGQLSMSVHPAEYVGVSQNGDFVYGVWPEGESGSTM